MVHLGSESKGPKTAVRGVFTWIKFQILTDHTERKGGSGDPTWIFFFLFRGLDSDGLPPTVGAHCSELRRHLDTHFFDVAEGHQGGDVGKGSRVAIQPIQKEKGKRPRSASFGRFQYKACFFRRYPLLLQWTATTTPRLCFSCYPSSQREVCILTSTQLIKNSPTSSQGDGEILEFPIRWGRWRRQRRWKHSSPGSLDWFDRNYIAMSHAYHTAMLLNWSTTLASCQYCVTALFLASFKASYAPGHKTVV